MTDVAQILGVSGPKKDSGAPPPLPLHHQPSRAMKLQGMPREVMGLLSGKQDSQSAELPPVVPSFNPDSAVGRKVAAAAATAASQEGSVKVGSKWISIKKPARKWTWAPFSSSSRTDGALFRHWVRANVEYPDYPYARFDIHLDPVTYSPEEYRRYLTSDSWTKSETDQLLEFARRFELRWPVIYDRWIELFYPRINNRVQPPADNNDDDNDDEMRKLEDLQHRYYSVAALLTQSRISQEAATEAQALASAAPEPSDGPKAAAEHLLMETAAARALASSDPQHQPLMHNLGAGISNKTFDLTHERERRAHMEVLWNRTKEDEVEEAELRKELKQVEAQLRKVKKSGGHILAAATGGGGGSKLNSASSSRNTSRAATPVPGTSELQPAVLDQAFASTAPTPTPQNPYLQSGRLFPPSMGGAAGLNKALLTRMDTVLEELEVPKTVLPTKRVCDAYDTVRKDILTLLVLQKNALQKEGLVQSKRLKLAKMGGNVRVVDEETLLGITPPPAPASASAAAANRTKTTKSKSKSSSYGGGGSGGKHASSKTKSSSATDDALNKSDLKDTPGGKQSRKPGTAKRKRKAGDSKSPRPPPVANATSAGAASATATTTTPVVAAPTSSKAADVGEGKSTGKKRSRKTNANA